MRALLFLKSMAFLFVAAQANAGACHQSILAAPDVPELSQLLSKMPNDSRTDLICSTGAQALPAIAEIETFISDHEAAGGSGMRETAIMKLTHKGMNNVVEAANTAQKAAMDECSGTHTLCHLIAYWNGDRELALRALALYYETGVKIQGAATESDEMFDRDMFYAIERSVRGVPQDLWSLLTGSGWSGPHEPFVIVQLSRGNGSYGSVLATGWTAGFALDQRSMRYLSPGRTWKGRKIAVDARQGQIIHEIAHRVSSAFEASGKRESSHIGSEWQRVIRTENGPLPPWNKNLYAKSGESRFSNEAYAEAFAMYMLAPEDLSRTRPAMFHFMKENVFSERQFSGFETCPSGGMFR